MPVWWSPGCPPLSIEPWFAETSQGEDQKSFGDLDIECALYEVHDVRGMH
jgi:hypothetical protein